MSFHARRFHYYYIQPWLEGVGPLLGDSNYNIYA